MDKQIELIDRLSSMLACMMDYAAEGGASKLIGFREAYKESNDVLDEANKAIDASEELKHYQDLDKGYSQDRI